MVILNSVVSNIFIILNSVADNILVFLEYSIAYSKEYVLCSLEIFQFKVTMYASSNIYACCLLAKQLLIKCILYASTCSISINFILVDHLINDFKCTISWGLIRKLQEFIFWYPILNSLPTIVLTFLLLAGTAIQFLLQGIFDLCVKCASFFIEVKILTWLLIQEKFTYYTVSMPGLKIDSIDISDLGADKSLVDWLIAIIKILLAHLIMTDMYWELVEYLNKLLDELMRRSHFGPRALQREIRALHYLFQLLIRLSAYMYILLQYALILWKIICFLEKKYIGFFDADKLINVSDSADAVWSVEKAKTAKLAEATKPGWPVRPTGSTKAIKVD